MKQRIEKAAYENLLLNHRTVDVELSGRSLRDFGASNFMEGVLWAERQNSWRNFRDELPEPNSHILCKVTPHDYVQASRYYCDYWDEDKANDLVLSQAGDIYEWKYFNK